MSAERLPWNWDHPLLDPMMDLLADYLDDRGIDSVGSGQIEVEEGAVTVRLSVTFDETAVPS